MGFPKEKSPGRRQRLLGSNGESRITCKETIRQTEETRWLPSVSHGPEGPRGPWTASSWKQAPMAEGGKTGASAPFNLQTCLVELIESLRFTNLVANI